MRTTITIDDHLLDEVRRRAAELRQTISQVIEDSVRESLLRRREDAREPFRVGAFNGGGYQPGVDLNDNAGLLDLMDSR
ncbi:MAG: ribbon-helix-helix domain-containing protein [Actinomycetota bacterium]|nr:ribbon-helix-helix domain-containing protein [Actinomycetota bacterium]